MIETIRAAYAEDPQMFGLFCIGALLFIAFAVGSFSRASI